MTVNNTNVTAGPYIGNNTSSMFSYEFKILDSDELNVYETDDNGVETLLTLDTDYTVQDVGEAVGTVTRSAGNLPTGYTWFIVSNYDELQETSFSSQGAFFPKIHERAFDKLTKLVQQTAYSVSNAFKNLNMRGFKITDLQDGVDPQDAVTFGQVLGAESTIGQLADSAADSAAASANSATASESALNTFVDTQWGAYATEPTLSPIGNPATAGDQYFNTTTNTMRVYNGTAWQATASSVSGIRNSYNFNNVAGQTVFNAVYDVGFVDVLYNGAEISPDNYTANDGLTVVLNAAVTKADDEINIKAYNYVDFGDASNLPVTATGTTTPRALRDRFSDEVRIADFGEDINAAWAYSKRLVGTAGHTYTLSSKLVSTGEDVYIDAPESNFVVDNTFGGFELAGAWINEQTVTNIVDSTEITVIDGSQYAEGDLVKIYSDESTPLHPTSSARKGEFAHVQAVNGNVISLAASTYETYSTASNTRLSKLDTKNCVLNIGSISFSSNITECDLEMLTIEAFEAPKIQVRKVRNVVPRGFCVLISCYGGDVQVGSIDNGTLAVGGYGVVLTNSENCNSTVTVARSMRHVMDAIAQFRGQLTPSGHGYAAYNLGYNSHSAFCEETSFIWHHGTHDNTYSNCTSYKSNSMVSFRGLRNKTVNCESLGDLVAIQAIQQSGDTGSITDESLCVDTTIRDTVNEIVAMSSEAGLLTLDGGSIDVTSDPSAVLTRLFGVTGSGGLILRGGLSVIERGSIFNKCISVGENTVTKVTLEDVTFDFTDADVQGTFSLVDNAIDAPILFRADKVRVYLPTGTFREFYEAPQLPIAGSHIGNLKLENLDYLTNSLRDGNDQAVPAWQGMIDGPIVDGFNKIGDAAINGTIDVSNTNFPEGNYVANPGSRYYRSTGGASTTLYVKESGVGKTGWVAK